MYDLPPDLPRLHTLRTWVALQLDHIDQAIAAAEKARQAPQQAPAPKCEPAKTRTPDWGITHQGLGAPVTEIHRGDCWADGGRMEAITQERAVAELSDGAQPCDACRPDRVLLRAQ
ncbi:DUF6233 domain-containing protein [Streptomyces sp. NBC_00101]|uniref:DUF6233 domain-containing protein n=1 Tax=Streptomyces sp. NBC_00101 TaxID=2975651 RepID=UPI003247C61A